MLNESLKWARVEKVCEPLLHEAACLTSLPVRSERALCARACVSELESGKEGWVVCVSVFAISAQDRRFLSNYTEGMLLNEYLCVVVSSSLQDSGADHVIAEA